MCHFPFYSFWKTLHTHALRNTAAHPLAFSLSLALYITVSLSLSSSNMELLRLVPCIACGRRRKTIPGIQTWLLFGEDRAGRQAGSDRQGGIPCLTFPKNSGHLTCMSFGRAAGAHLPPRQTGCFKNFRAGLGTGSTFFPSVRSVYAWQLGGHWHFPKCGRPSHAVSLSFPYLLSLCRGRDTHFHSLPFLRREAFSHCLSLGTSHSLLGEGSSLAAPRLPPPSLGGGGAARHALPAPCPFSLRSDIQGRGAGKRTSDRPDIKGSFCLTFLHATLWRLAFLAFLCSLRGGRSGRGEGEHHCFIYPLCFFWAHTLCALCWEHPIVRPVIENSTAHAYMGLTCLSFTACHYLPACLPAPNTRPQVRTSPLPTPYPRGLHEDFPPHTWHGGMPSHQHASSVLSAYGGWQLGW